MSASCLFNPITLRGLALANRIVVAPMSQHSAEAGGNAGDFHVMHLGQFAVSGAGLVITESVWVSADGLNTPSCLGLWSDAHERALARVVGFCASFGKAAIGIQLGHAGRKGSVQVPWEGGEPLRPDAGGWQTVAPSADPLAEAWPVPAALDAAGLERVEASFVQAIERAARAGFALAEIHAAHGYLLHQFLSPVTNRRDDEWGGAREGRMRLPLQVVAAARKAWPDDRPLGVRVSATDWIEGGWDLDDTIAFVHELARLGCDYVHVSSGGLAPAQRIAAGPGYQVPFAAGVKAATGVATVAVGEITEPRQADTVIRSGQADMVAIARAMLFDPRWGWRAAHALGADVDYPPQYRRANPALRGIRGLAEPGKPPPALKR